MTTEKSSTARVLKTIAFVVIMYLVAGIFETATSATYTGGYSLIVILIILSIAAPNVGYRWFDCLFALIPIYGIIFIFRIAYRLAYLPNRDWDERTS